MSIKVTYAVLAELIRDVFDTGLCDPLTDLSPAQIQAQPLTIRKLPFDQSQIAALRRKLKKKKVNKRPK